MISRYELYRRPALRDLLVQLALCGAARSVRSLITAVSWMHCCGRIIATARGPGCRARATSRRNQQTRYSALPHPERQAHPRVFCRFRSASSTRTRSRSREVGPARPRTAAPQVGRFGTVDGAGNMRGADMLRKAPGDFNPTACGVIVPSKVRTTGVPVPPVSRL